MEHIRHTRQITAENQLEAERIFWKWIKKNYSNSYRDIQVDNIIKGGD
jgi:hypothetical protein